MRAHAIMHIHVTCGDSISRVAIYVFSVFISGKSQTRTSPWCSSQTVTQLT